MKKNPSQLFGLPVTTEDVPRPDWTPLQVKLVRPDDQARMDAYKAIPSWGEGNSTVGHGAA